MFLDRNPATWVKFSPADMDIELITRFDINKSFDEAWKDSREIVLERDNSLCYRILSFDDLIISKIKSDRPKDQLDIIELKRIREEGNFEA